MIGADKRILPPKDINSQDQEITMKWLRDLEMWNDQCLERTKKVTEDVFPINYHLYVIDCCADGEIEIEMEETRGIMGMSCSGDINKLHSRIRDIYIYYGVSQADINNSTNRYKILIAELSNS